MSVSPSNEFRKSVELKLFHVDVDHDKDAHAELNLYGRSFFNKVRRSDIVQIYIDEKSATPGRTIPRLLAEVTSVDDQNRDSASLSIEKSASTYFGLKNYIDVIVENVDADYVALDLCEIRFKEQFITRSDMWRMKNYLLEQSRCVYLEKQLRFCGIRCQIGELWTRGERVTAGIITENTRIVWRSCSAIVCLFIQLSREMWEFDVQGDLYFEKCVTGFLPEFFEKFKEEKCAHYVTIVLFSRWFYDAKSREDLPSSVRNNVRKDYRGRYYQDFYRLIVQNELYEDWQPTITRLKPLLNDYPEIMRKYISSLGHGEPMPNARNSSAIDGNFLETINMSMNVFVKHHMDRNFERTGQMNIIISPGGGVFSVDYNFAGLTKQRVIDEGVSVDLVCLGEQPLHAVPLFMFGAARSDYNIPHWLNYSYYNPIKYMRSCCQFMPRIRVPDSLLNAPSVGIIMERRMDDVVDPVTEHIDYDEWDRQMFLPQSKTNKKFTSHMESSQPTDQFTEALSPTEEEQEDRIYRENSAGPSANITGSLKKCSPSPARKPNRVAGNVKEYIHSRAPSNPKPINHSSMDKADEGFDERPVVGSAGAEGRRFIMDNNNRLGHIPQAKPISSLFNPFKPAEYSVTITANRRRWIHVFPTDANGMAKQAHHFVAGTSIIHANTEPRTSHQSVSISAPTEDGSLIEADADVLASARSDFDSPGSSYCPPASFERMGSKEGPRQSRGDSSAATTLKTKVWAWGPTGEEQWNPNIEIGMDWRALSLPGCLPITTDFFPDSHSMQHSYVFYEYTVHLEERISEGKWNNAYEIFDELICQRLQQGFQIITLPEDMLHSATCALIGSTQFFGRRFVKECYMSINRIYHRLALSENLNDIDVSKFTPRHLYPLDTIQYNYMFQAPDSVAYATSKTTFQHLALERFNWSRLDQFIASKGEEEDILPREKTEILRFYEARFMLLPRSHLGISTIREDPDRNCDIFENLHEGEHMTPEALTEGFLKFMTAWNRVCHPMTSQRKVSERVKRKISMDNPPPQLAPPDVGDSTGAATEPEVVPNLSAAVQLAMKDPRYNMTFLEQESSHFKGNTFVAAHFVHWAKNNVAGVETLDDAVEVGQKLVDENKIIHISGSSQIRFEFGFFLYIIIEDAPTITPKTDFLEARVYPYSAVPGKQSGQSDVTCIFDQRTSQIPVQHLTPRNERHEWVWLSHASTYWPGMAFEISIQWSVATGAVIGDLLRTVCSYAHSSLFHLVPVPADPFALPYNPNSDPLRCPVNVNLKASEQLKSFDDNKLKKLQCAILKRFGFISMVCEYHRRAKQFIHLSGGMFVLIAKPSDGFQWAWNNMLGKRFRNHDCSADEAFQDRMLADFRSFCNNDNDRLSCFIHDFMMLHWEE